ATQNRLPDDPDQLKQLVAALLSEKQSLLSEKKSLLSEKESLSSEKATLIVEKQSLQSELQQVRLKLLRFEEQQRLLLAKRFGASSEKSPQIALFNEAEALLQEEAAIADDAITQA
ncbi:IS66 family transposase, partial [Microbulbifer thermotolerans]